ncbi:putative micrococcal nuclease [Helianthus debilis subsp. tardiflorus]
MAQPAVSSGWLRGKVKVVPSGDTLVIMGVTNAEIPLRRLWFWPIFRLQDWYVYLNNPVKCLTLCECTVNLISKPYCFG